MYGRKPLPQTYAARGNYGFDLYSDGGGSKGEYCTMKQLFVLFHQMMVTRNNPSSRQSFNAGTRNGTSGMRAQTSPEHFAQAQQRTSHSESSVTTVWAADPKLTPSSDVQGVA
jgi:hypothetical protein